MNSQRAAHEQQRHRPVADFEHSDLVFRNNEYSDDHVLQHGQRGKDEIVTSRFVLVRNYLYPACVADMVLGARIGTHEASP
jgi:hypothetical protein